MSPAVCSAAAVGAAYIFRHAMQSYDQRDGFMYGGGRTCEVDQGVKLTIGGAGRGIGSAGVVVGTWYSKLDCGVKWVGGCNGVVDKLGSAVVVRSRRSALS
jgi:hypothetical protein